MANGTALFELQYLNQTLWVVGKVWQFVLCRMQSVHMYVSCLT